LARKWKKINVNEFLSFSEDRRRTVCEQAQDKLGLPPATIEKDFWVCWALKKLFNLPKWGPRLTFKGGTLLSKGWGLIERFSEDIDIVIDRDALGFGGNMSPDHAPSKKQTRKRLDALKAARRQCVNETLLPLFEDVISHEMPEELSCQIDPDPDDPDGQTLLLVYPTAFADQMAYLRQVVKIELGARSDIEPTQKIDIHPYLEDAFPDLFPQSHFSVKAVSRERIFWEKSMLLHEETFRPTDKKRKARMARHYYDLYRLINAGIGRKAAGDLELFDRIAAHRQVYFRYSWVDYDTLCPGRLRLVPPDEQLAVWKADYAAMKDEMFFGKTPEFEDIIQTAREFQDEFNRRSEAASS
jgi:predicted nucleotidyltransferase component of viral defense system